MVMAGPGIERINRSSEGWRVGEQAAEHLRADRRSSHFVDRIRPAVTAISVAGAVAFPSSAHRRDRRDRRRNTYFSQIKDDGNAVRYPDGGAEWVLANRLYHEFPFVPNISHKSLLPGPSHLFQFPQKPFKRRIKAFAIDTSNSCPSECVPRGVESQRRRTTVDGLRSNRRSAVGWPACR